VDLSAGALSKGIKQFGEKFEHISDEAQLLAVAAQLKSEIDGFKSTVPLFEALKCDALRDRHWRSLMDSTDKRFDVAPESLRLQNLFDMELHLHEQMTYRILQQAQEELKIENLLICMRKTWQLEDFRVEKFQVDGQEHGLILGSFDEPLSHLTEHQAQLQMLLNSE
jgi:Dynein heavy chain, N-terminal region 2